MPYGSDQDGNQEGRRSMKEGKQTYRMAFALAIVSVLMLLWLIGAVGVIGVEGDPADGMYLGVIAVGLLGAIIARFRPSGMAYALFAMAGAQAVVAVIAMILGKHQSPVTSVYELWGLTGMFAAMFVGSAFLFRKAARDGQTV